MTGLAEWLLEAIAEDERVVPTPDFERQSTSRAWYSTDFDVVFVEQDRWLADCAAKRKIVQWAKLWTDSEPDDPADPAPALLRTALRGMLSTLAAPYSDRPGFREEWRV